MREIISTKEAVKPAGPYSQAVRYGSTVYVAGQTAENPETGEIEKGTVAQQTERVLSSIKAILEAAGSGMDKVLKCNVYLSSMEHFDEMNSVYARFFPADPPARLTVAVNGMYGGLDVEIDAIAAV